MPAASFGASGASPVAATARVRMADIIGDERHTRHAPPRREPERRKEARSEIAAEQRPSMSAATSRTAAAHSRAARR